MVPFVRGWATPLRPLLGRSGFIEWLEWLNPCVRGFPGVLRTFGMVLWIRRSSKIS